MRLPASSLKDEKPYPSCYPECNPQRLYTSQKFRTADRKVVCLKNSRGCLNIANCQDIPSRSAGSRVKKYYSPVSQSPHFLLFTRRHGAKTENPHCRRQHRCPRAIRSSSQKRGL